jgi:hypothetical protein
MCYSFRASIVAFLVAIVTVFFMYNRQTTIDKYVGPLIFIYSFVQLAEAFMWYDTKCGKINKIGTYIAYISLILHVLAVGLGIYLVENKIYGLIIGTIIFIYYLIKMPEMKCSKQIKIHMHWGFDPRYYLLSFLLMSLLFFTSNMRIIYKAIIFITFTILWLYFFYKQSNFKISFKIFKSLLFGTLNYDAHSIGSAWCHVASAGAPFLYLIQYAIK